MKGDPRCNRNGRPKSFDQLRSLALQIAAENVIDAGGNTITRAEQLLRSWAKSRQPALQLAFAAYAWGKPPEKIEAPGLLQPKRRSSCVSTTSGQTMNDQIPNDQQLDSSNYLRAAMAMQNRPNSV